MSSLPPPSISAGAISGVLVLRVSSWVKPSSVSAPPATMTSSFQPPLRMSIPSSMIVAARLAVAEDPVVARRAEDLVVAGAGEDRVVLLLAVDDVVAGAAVELVGAAAAAEDVVALASLDDVVVATAVEQVVAAEAEEAVLAAQPGDAVAAVAAAPVVALVVELLLALEADRRLLRGGDRREREREQPRATARARSSCRACAGDVPPTPLSGARADTLSRCARLAGEAERDRGVLTGAAPGRSRSSTGARPRRS